MRQLFFSLGLGISCLVLLFSPARAQVRPLFDMRMPMRDGVELSADVWMPQEAGRYPAIIMRTPYLKTDSEVERAVEWGQYFASRGYVFLMQDVRGRGDSDGDFDFFFQEGKDGYDTVEWIAAQGWSNGRVGMMGSSYLGTVQWLAARERAPHLACIVPTASGGRWFEELPYKGGAFLMGWAVSWIAGTSGRIPQSNLRGVDMDRVYQHRPLITMDEAAGRKMPLYKAILEHDTVDDYWKRIMFAPSHYRQFDIPALHVTGWFDGDQPGALLYWEGTREYSPARDKQYLIIGPWDHGQTFVGGALSVGEMKFSPNSIVDLEELHLSFFDYCLKQTTSTVDFPRARIYVTGSNTWLEEPEYPPAAVEYERLYFHSGGRANTLAGDGRLSWNAPKQEPPDRYTYNPEHPTPMSVDGGSLAKDYRAIERRDDVLVYSTDELQETVTVVGRVEVHLYASSSARDTDFTARVLDVYPDGRAVNLGPSLGVIRARYRNGYEATELLTPNEVAEFRINLHDIGHAFLPGHRIRVEISSSAYPAVHPNPNTGNPIATDTEWNVADQTVYHDAERASYVLMPVLPNR